MIPLCVPEIRGNEWKYVKDCLDTGWVSSVGTYVNRFENQIADYLGVKHAVATVNGTAALHIALLVAGIKPDDEVLVSTLTFIAPVNAIRYIGAYPVFMDAEPDYWQIDVQKVVDFVERECKWIDGKLRNKVSGRYVRGILPVHILGHPVDLDPLLELASKYNLKIIEDATESIGACYKSRKVGSQGDLACFSFNGNKLITTGGGGMIATNHESLAERARYLTTQAKDHPIEYIHNEIGYNYRLTNIQAAIGCAQLEQIDSFIATKRDLSSNYSNSLLRVNGIRVMLEAPWAQSCWWMYTIQVNEKVYGKNSRDVLQHLNSLAIQSRPLWQPIHQSPAYIGYQSYYCNIANRLYREGLSLPCSIGLTMSEQAKVISAI